MKLYRRGKKYARLLNRRLERAKYYQSQLNQRISSLMAQIKEMESQINILEAQCDLFDQAMECSRQVFFEGRRQKAIVLADIARQKHRHEQLLAELKRVEQQRIQQTQLLKQLNARCEKFQVFLGRRLRNHRIQVESRAAHEIEELLIHGNSEYKR
ncbi:Uncharacterised protein [Serratia quinivorans]|uniref:hypothetical protein n=1 Tax=Serratia quinivorans TaxID=137545 RepID=UPI0021799C5C|nr:hypothetical protein [Serratia quinivorans]CAI1904211.1 Uncharacterised protein [Serratia quinivorans]